MAVCFPDASCSEMFKRKRVHQCVSDRAGILTRIFDEPLLVDGFEFDLIEAGFETRLQSQVDPIEQGLLWFCNRVFRITCLLFDKAPVQSF